MNTSGFFDDYFNHAEVNNILVMECDGTIRNVNKSFTNNFGYNNEDLIEKNFDTLFTMEDKEKSKPQLELEGVVSTGQFNDDNYVVSKEGHAIWCTGESLLVTGGEGKKYIVKGIINMQAKKQLNLFLMEANDLLERVFIAGKNIPMMILDGSMKIQKVNNAFLDLFEITESPLGGSRVSELNHPFWSNEDLKNDLRLIIINNKPFRDKKFILQTKSGEKKTIKIDSKIIESEPLTGRKIFLLIEEVAYIKPMNVETK